VTGPLPAKTFIRGDLSWRLRALCLDVPEEVFFPSRGEKAEANAAKAICHVCAVESECLEFALSFPSTYDRGVFGGMTAIERGQERTRRRREA